MMDIVERLKDWGVVYPEDDSEDDLLFLNAADEITRLREVVIRLSASLVAAIDLLERGGKNAAWSDKVFDQMLKDYKASVDAARSVLQEDE